MALQTPFQIIFVNSIYFRTGSASGTKCKRYKVSYKHLHSPLQQPSTSVQRLLLLLLLCVLTSVYILVFIVIVQILPYLAFVPCFSFLFFESEYLGGYVSISAHGTTAQYSIICTYQELFLINFQYLWELKMFLNCYKNIAINSNYYICLFLYPICNINIQNQNG